jgi:hypothetical protein
MTFANVESALDNLGQKAPQLLSKRLLIGGWCALLYYRLLVRRGDTDHPAPVPENKERLQSSEGDQKSRLESKRIEPTSC